MPLPAEFGRIGRLAIKREFLEPFGIARDMDVASVAAKQLDILLP